MHSDKASEKLNIKNFHVGRGSATMMKLIVVIVNALIPSLVFVPCARRMRCFTIDKDNDCRFGKRNGESTICKKDLSACMTSVTNALLCTNGKLPNVVFEWYKQN